MNKVLTETNDAELAADAELQRKRLQYAKELIDYKKQLSNEEHLRELSMEQEARKIVLKQTKKALSDESRAKIEAFQAESAKIKSIKDKDEKKRRKEEQKLREKDLKQQLGDDIELYKKEQAEKKKLQQKFQKEQIDQQKNNLSDVFGKGKTWQERKDA